MIWDREITTKWPAARLLGPSVSRELALEYIRRTDDALRWPEHAGLYLEEASDDVAQTVAELIAANSQQAELYSRKPSVLGWFVGQVMKRHGRSADPKKVNELVREALNSAGGS